MNTLKREWTAVAVLAGFLAWTALSAAIYEWAERLPEPIPATVVECRHIGGKQ